MRSRLGIGWKYNVENNNEGFKLSLDKIKFKLIFEKLEDKQLKEVEVKQDKFEECRCLFWNDADNFENPILRRQCGHFFFLLKR